jgi:hypothetical protein
MGLFSEINRINNGRGPRVLTQRGSDLLRAQELDEKRERGINPNKDVSDERWYREAKNALFAPELEGDTWCHARAVKY